ncbi:hypothetical protein BD626DRAFT_589067 [Schizophyllum amplum]|uniref:Uncharacterized protein n=1 Tax=Schizophyllum amplum TaxID=97359 RepID=A0A550BRS0_9AGAR|nr:hypothetical protein BD626DRAFT_589067 [Auriculariopsis ampla]
MALAKVETVMSCMSLYVEFKEMRKRREAAKEKEKARLRFSNFELPIVETDWSSTAGGTAGSYRTMLSVRALEDIQRLIAQHSGVFEWGPPVSTPQPALASSPAPMQEPVQEPAPAPEPETMPEPATELARLSALEPVIEADEITELDYAETTPAASLVSLPTIRLVPQSSPSFELAPLPFGGQPRTPLSARSSMSSHASMHSSMSTVSQQSVTLSTQHSNSLSVQPSTRLPTRRPDIIIERFSMSRTTQPAVEQPLLSLDTQSPPGLWRRNALRTVQRAARPTQTRRAPRVVQPMESFLSLGSSTATQSSFADSSVLGGNY